MGNQYKAVQGPAVTQYGERLCGELSLPEEPQQRLQSQPHPAGPWRERARAVELHQSLPTVQVEPHMSEHTVNPSPWRQVRTHLS